MSTKVNLLVKDVMLLFHETPVASNDIILREVLETMDRFRLGVVCIINEKKEILGIVTDGDIRRMLTRVQKPISALLGDDIEKYCILNPATISSEDTLKKALQIMQEKQIWDIPVADDDVLVGLLHLHPAIKAVLNLQ